MNFKNSFFVEVSCLGIVLGIVNDGSNDGSNDGPNDGPNDDSRECDALLKNA